MKKNKLTFSQRAKAIEKKFGRSKFDPIEAKEMENELEGLMAEQESVREAMGLNQEEQPQQFAGGGGVEDDIDIYGEGNPYINSIPTPYLSSFKSPVNLANPYLSQIDTQNPSINAGFEGGRQAPNLDNIYNEGVTYGNTTSKGFNQGMIASGAGIGRIDDINRLNSGLPKTNYRQADIDRLNTGIPINNIKKNGKSNIPIVAADVNTDSDAFYNDFLQRQEPSMMAAKQGSDTPAVQSTLDSERAKEVMANLRNEVSPTSQVGKTKGKGINKDMLPYALSGASNIASNLLMAKLAGKYKKTNAVQAYADEVNFDPQVEQLRKDATTSKNVNMRNARNIGAGQSAILSGASSAGVDRNFGKAVTDLYSKEGIINSQAKNKVNALNAQSKTRANMMNTQVGNRANENKLGFLDQALGTIPEVMRDIRADKSDKEMRTIQDNYYKTFGTHTKQEGSLWQSGEYTYGIREGEVVKIGLTKDLDKNSKVNELKKFKMPILQKQKFKTIR